MPLIPFVHLWSAKLRCGPFWRALYLVLPSCLLRPSPSSFLTSSQDTKHCKLHSTWWRSLPCAASGGGITNPHQATRLQGPGTWLLRQLLGPCSATGTQAFPLPPCSVILQPGHLPFHGRISLEVASGPPSPFKTHLVCFLPLGGIPALLRPFQINSDAFPIPRTTSSSGGQLSCSWVSRCCPAAALACLGEELPLHDGRGHWWELCCCCRTWPLPLPSPSLYHSDLIPIEHESFSTPSSRAPQEPNQSGVLCHFNHCPSASPSGLLKAKSKGHPKPQPFIPLIAPSSHHGLLHSPLKCQGSPWHFSSTRLSR